MAWNSAFKSNWTGASGIQIGYADQYPVDKYDSFTADEVHGNPVNPNQPNQYRQTGSSIGDVPIQIQSDDSYVDYGMGADGWVLDNIDMPSENDRAATQGHGSSMGPAKGRGPDIAHRQEVFQENLPRGFGRDFYGGRWDTLDLAAWKSSQTKAPTTGTAILDAREVTDKWPTPFDSTTVAPLLPNIRTTDKIPMRRMQQDDRPTYRTLAVPSANVQPSGSVYNPQVPSNTYLKVTTPIPAAYTIPVDPAVSQDALSQSVMDSGDDYDSVGYWQ